MKFKFFYYSILLYYLLARISYAQQVILNTNYENFFDNQWSTISTLTSANSSLSQYSGIFTYWYNPALYKAKPKTEIEASYLTFPDQDLRSWSAGFLKSELKSTFVLGYINSRSYSVVDGKSFFKNQNFNQSFSTNFNLESFFMGYAYVQGIFTIGGSFKYTYKNFGDMLLTNSFAFDLGINFINNKRRNFAFIVQNASGSHEFRKYNLSLLTDYLNFQNHQSPVVFQDVAHSVSLSTLVLCFKENFYETTDLKSSFLVDLQNFIGNNPTYLINSTLFSLNFKSCIESIMFNKYFFKISTMGIFKNLNDRYTVPYSFGMGYLNDKFRIELGIVNQIRLNESNWIWGINLSCNVN